MLRRLFFTAILAGLITGLITSALHQVTTVPIILKAESYEIASAAKFSSSSSKAVAAAFLAPPASTIPSYHPVHGADDSQGQATTWVPKEGLERAFFSTLTNTLLAIGFALLLVSGMIIRGETVDVRRGLLWGAGGFVVFTLAPSLGLPPEIPGIATADLVPRQTWWISAAAAAVGGLWLLIFADGLVRKTIGVAIMVIPHLVGAPHPNELGTVKIPAELAAQFASTSIVISAVFWALLGGLSGYFHGRDEPAH